MAELFAGAAAAAKGGFVREALTASFPRLAALLEEALAKLRRDTDVRSCLAQHKHTDSRGIRNAGILCGLVSDCCASTCQIQSHNRCCVHGA